MKKKLKELFPEDVQKILTEESLEAIETAITNKVDLAVEGALIQQDDEYATKLQSLMEMVDTDRSNKLERVMEALDKNYASKLLKIVKKYERDQLNEAKKFKSQMISTINAFLDDEAISSIVSESDLSQAVKNKTAFNVLNGLRNALAVDSSLMNPAIQEAVLDGKKQITDKDKKLKELQEKFNSQTQRVINAERKLFLVEKSANLSEDKRKFVNKMLEDKSLDFIKENFDYAVKLFDKQEKKELKVIKEQAVNNRKIKPDFVKPEKVIEEKVNKNNEENPYLMELEKVRKY